MKQEKSSVYIPIRPANRPIKLIRHPLPSTEGDSARLAPPADRSRDVSTENLPTKKLSLLSNAEGLNRSQSPFTLTPEDYLQLDDQLDDALDLSSMNTVQLMQMSGVMRSISVQIPIVRKDAAVLSPGAYKQDFLTVVPAVPAVAKKTSKLANLLNNSFVKMFLGLAIGVLIILLMSRLIDFKATAQVIESHLTTPAGILHTCLAGLAFVAAFTFRGTRWKLFLNSVKDIPVLKVIRIYWIGVFINFLLPVQGGELAKSVMLKRVAGVPISQSLPTVAIDKALDLLPVLFIIAIVPFIPDIHMNITLWLILALVGGILLGLIVVVALTAWNRKAAVSLISFFLHLLPKGLGSKIEGFAMGFVDSLLAGASRPQAFIPAILLTMMAICCEGLFAWEGFQAIGLDMNLGIAIFGYTVYTMFSILPTPPAGVGTNEGAKTIVFVTLLGFNAVKVNAMAILVHPVCAVLIGGIGLISLRTLGLSLSTIMQKQEHQKETRVAKTQG